MSTHSDTLSNGIRLVFEEMPHVLTTAITVDIGVGSRDELPHEHGLAHFLEHMAFKGTHTRTAKQIAEEIENVGGDINASTSIESTCYTVRVLSEFTPLAFEILSDILLNPTFPQEEIEREKGVVLQELLGYEDMPDSLVYDYFMECAYANQAIGRPIIGTKQSIPSFTRDMIVEYRNRCYCPQNIVVSVAGSFDKKRIKDLIEHAFGKIQPQAKVQLSQAIYTGGERTVKRPIEQAHLMVGYIGQAQTSSQALALDLFSSIVGGGLSSRLFQQIRELQGLAYSIYSYTQPMLDTGVFSVYAGTAADKAQSVIDQIQTLLHTSAKDITDEELMRAKSQVKAALAMNLESPSARADQLARHIHIYGKVLSMKEMLKRLENTTREDVLLAAQTMLSSKPILTQVLPKKRFFM